MIDDLAAYLDASPTPWHAVATTESRLVAAGFLAMDLGAAPTPLAPGHRGYVAIGGTIVAFRVGFEPVAQSGFHIVTAHTDSPVLRIKPNPVLRSNGIVRLGVEVYGGVLLHTWTDRELGIAGLVHTRDGRSTCVDLRRPLCRIPNLAIHLQRTVNEDGLKLNPQTHLPAVLGLEEGSGADPLRDLLGDAVSCAPQEVVSWDLCLVDLVPAAVSGVGREFLHSGRLDNLASCHSALAGLLSSLDASPNSTAVIALFDHEEIGSTTSRGANGRVLETVLTALVDRVTPVAPGGLVRALAHSFVVSVDMAHAVHPAFPDKHEPNHLPRMGLGPVIKQNANQRYATEGAGAARFARLCADVGSPVQWFVNRSDLACGSTVGPMVTAHLGCPGVDVGNAMWSMHSARETCGTADPVWMSAALGRHLSGNR